MKGRKVPEAIRWRILELYQMRLSFAVIAARTGLSKWTVSRVIHEARDAVPEQCTVSLPAA